MDWQTALVLLALLFLFLRRFKGKRRNYSYRRKKWLYAKRAPDSQIDWSAYAEVRNSPEIDNEPVAASDLSVVTNTSYEPRQIMGREEAYVLYKLENWVKARGHKERVFPQVPMGTYLKATNDSAHILIRSKRPDYLIVNRRGLPICVVEYQGGGHFQGNAEERDAIKKAALKNANIPLVEIFADEKDNVDLVYQKLDAAVGTPDAVMAEKSALK